MKEKGLFLAVFNNTHETLLAEKLFKEGGIKIKTRMKPRSFTSECGMALEFPEGEISRIEEICRYRHLKVVGLYRELETGDWRIMDSDRG